MSVYVGLSVNLCVHFNNFFKGNKTLFPTSTGYIVKMQLLRKL